METVSTGTERQSQATAPFVGEWRRLVSVTNWEKGRIISAWRSALMKARAKSQEYSDESWARLVGGITPQHVGRLRRVHDRFHPVAESYPGLFWSHFHAAIDWEDGEMWLEGALQNHWSVSQMRSQRWETLGGEQPSELDEVTTEIDEDVEVSDAAESGTQECDTTLEATLGDPESRDPPAKGDNRHADWGSDTPTNAPDAGEILGERAAERPFAQVTQLPGDLAEAMESFKMAILRHKLAGWCHVTAQEVISALDALRGLVLAPSEVH